MNNHLNVPTQEAIEQHWSRLQSLTNATPVLRSGMEALGLAADIGATLWLKLELFQYAGSFKTRAAMGILDDFQRRGQALPGVVTASGGNHALALAYAAKHFKVKAAVVMPETASPFRIERCKALGAEVILADNIAEVFTQAMHIAKERGFEFVHPFDGYMTSLGTATLAYEFLKSVPPLDCIIVPVGGGGLISGIAAYVKQALPACEVIGVEPATANVISRSLASGQPEQLPQTQSIADSLSSPLACDYSFSLIKRYVDLVVTLEEAEIQQAMRVMQENFKLAVEPAAACAMGALMGPLKDRWQQSLKGKGRGKHIGIVVCGSNIDAARYQSLLR